MSKSIFSASSSFLYLYVSLLLLIFLGSGLRAGAQTRIPKEERPIDQLDFRVNKIEFLQQAFPWLDGSGLTVSIKEQRFDSVDLDLLGRYLPSGLSSRQVATHSTSMATIIGGSGATYRTGKGVAPKVLLSSASFFRLQPEPMRYYLENMITVQNHSYGVGIENFYGLEARQYDSLVYHYPELVHVFSAGNLGEMTSTSGPYSDLAQVANLSGTFKMAKNVLCIGAVDQQLQLEPESSRGPAYDGRIKPDLVAYGEDGSSGGAAITSGVLLLLQQAFAAQNAGQLPTQDLLKACLINSAEDLEQPGPDFTTGFGNLNAPKALNAILNNQYWQDQLQEQEIKSIPLEIPEGIAQLKISLAWIDPPATIDAPQALVNDLDLSLIYSAEQDTILPWVLNSSPQLNALNAAAVRGIDRLNNVEQITLNLPPAGQYQVLVRGHQLETEEQAFSITYQMDSLEHFQWWSPGPNTIFETQKTESLFWEHQGIDSKGLLYFQEIGQGDWVFIDTLELAQKRYDWAVPNFIGQGRLALQVGEVLHPSDTFLISPEIVLNFGYDCEADILLEYATPGVERYRIFQLQNNEMLPLLDTTASSLSLAKRSDLPDEVFAVAPLIEGTYEGLRSLSLQAKLQKAVCYLGDLTIDLIANSALVQFQVSTSYELGRVFLEKKINGEFQEVQAWPVSGLSYSWLDENLQNGINQYRAGVVLQDGRIIYSNINGLFYLAPNSLLVYPNPLLSGQLLSINTIDYQERRILVFDTWGRLILNYDLLSPFEVLETDNWPAGMYFYKMIDVDGVIEHSGKIFVR